MRSSIVSSIDQQFPVHYAYPVIFTSGVFDTFNPVLRDAIQGTGVRYRKLFFAVDSGLVEAQPGLVECVRRYLGLSPGLPPLVGPACVLRGGESCKNDMEDVGRIHAFVERLGLCRHSLILAAGGGSFLDAAGYAAATAHRGIPLLRLPTTTLSQNDSGVGVKNAVNAFGRKNFLGVFAPPVAVINDLELLRTLPEKDLRAGIAEAVKVALIRDAAFFGFLFAKRLLLARFDHGVMQEMIIRCARLHCEHIRSGDPFETGSSRPLDFGHWSAHKCEDMTRGQLGHGEAVAMGIALDCFYCHRKGLLPLRDLNRVLQLLEDTGFELYHPVLAELDIERALADFREHLGGELTIPLISGIGSVVEAHELDTGLYRQCIHQLAARKGDRYERDSVPVVGRRDHGHLFS